MASGASRPPSENQVATPVHMLRIAAAVSFTSGTWKTPPRMPAVSRPRNTSSYWSRLAMTRRRLAGVRERSSLWLTNASCRRRAWKTTWKRTAARSWRSAPAARVAIPIERPLGYRRRAPVSRTRCRLALTQIRTLRFPEQDGAPLLPGGLDHRRARDGDRRELVPPFEGPRRVDQRARVQTLRSGRDDGVERP